MPKLTMVRFVEKFKDIDGKEKIRERFEALGKNNAIKLLLSGADYRLKRV